jgi:hypothetical protein
MAPGGRFEHGSVLGGKNRGARVSSQWKSTLLLHSDLVPGLSPGRIDGYWTGIPLPVAKVYALMRTWPAPEIPRPGCVWTHVVVIALADMARFPDLAVLESLFARPSISAGYGAYATPLTIDPGCAAPRTSLSRQSCLRVLRALYAPRSPGILPHYNQPLDAAIFAVWSQQWPRLRRVFSFRTAGFAADLSNTVRFDLQVVRETASSAPLIQADASSQPADWESAASDDLLAPEPSDFRRFLWRYGSDITRGRDRYRFLAQLFLTTRLPILEGTNLAQTLDTVIETLPEAEEGKLLKEDLLSCGHSLYSLLPAADPIDTLGYLVDHTDLSALQSSEGAVFEAVRDLWTARPLEILAIAERAVNESSAIADELLDRLSAVAEPKSFLALSRKHPIARERLIRENPALLDSPDLASVPLQELSQILALLPNDQELAGRVLDRVLFSDNSDVAALFSDRFLDLTQGRVFDALVSELAGSGSEVPRVWPHTVRQRSPNLVSRMLERSRTTTALAALSGWLNLDVSAGLEASPSKWAAALIHLEDDIRGQPRQRLLAYLLALALARPGPGCEPLFEKAFESVHADISASRLPLDAFDAISRFLPDLYWWERWDTCHRLRVAVVEAYVSADLDPQSFRRLTSNEELFERLVDIAAETKPGRPFLSRVRH